MPRPKSTFGAIIELVVIVAFAIGLALLIQAFVVKPFQIPTGSMIPTLDPGQRVLVERFGYRFGDPEVDDIIVFHPPQDTRCAPGARTPEQACSEAFDQESETNFIKRVVAGPGDTLSIRDGHPVVNGIEAEEDFTRKCGASATVPCNLPEEIEIPPDHYFMMGDNRGHSDDSRIWGPVPREWIIGRAFATYWPINRIGLF